MVMSAKKRKQIREIICEGGYLLHVVIRKIFSEKQHLFIYLFIYLLALGVKLMTSCLLKVIFKQA